MRTSEEKREGEEEEGEGEREIEKRPRHDLDVVVGFVIVFFSSSFVSLQLFGIYLFVERFVLHLRVNRPRKAAIVYASK